MHSKNTFLIAAILVWASSASPQTNEHLRAAKRSREHKTQLLSRKHNMRDPAVRTEIVKTLTEIEEARRKEVHTFASKRGFKLRGEKPGGGHFELVDFDDDGTPVYEQTENINAAISTGAVFVRNTAPYNVNGSSVEIGLWESGGVPRTSHQDLTGRTIVWDGTESTSSHATHVAGTLASAGVSSGTLGMAPAATLACRNSLNGTAEMADRGATAPNSSLIYLSNHSYGYRRGWEGNTWYGSFSNDGNRDNDVEDDFGRYGSYAVTWDGIAFNAPYHLIFVAAGNHGNNGPPSNGSSWNHNGNSYSYDSSQHPRGDGGYKNGYDCMEGFKLSKNVMTIGATGDAVGSAGGRWVGGTGLVNFSSEGPADDGRIKPDIVANGLNVKSCNNSGNAATTTLSGTSMASPNACGSAALLIDYYRTRFPGLDMRASTLKALIIHTADDMGVAGPDYKFGWGLMDTEAAADIVRMHADDTGEASIIESSVSDSSPSRTHTFAWSAGEPLRVTLCWTDPPGTSKSGHDNRARALVNDLNVSLRASVGNGTSTNLVLIDFDDGNSANGIHDTAILNGGFEDNTVGSGETPDRNTYAETDHWINIDTADQTAHDFIRDDISDGAGEENTSDQSAIVTDYPDRQAAVDTEHTLAQGESFFFSYKWRDASAWSDGNDHVVFTFYTTDDNTISGSVHKSQSFQSGLSLENNSYQAASGYFSVPASMNGKRLFVSLNGKNNGGGADGFSRVDDVYLVRTASDGIYLPYVMPYVSDWSEEKLDDPAIPGVNNVDTIEQINIAAAPETDLYTVTVDFAGTLSGGEQDYSLIVSGQAFSDPTVLDGWRFVNFGTTNNAGSTADLADYEGDGIVNMVEFGMATDPTASNGLPVSLSSMNNLFSYVYQRNMHALDDLTFNVLWTDNLTNTIWNSAGITETILTDDGDIQSVQADIPMGMETNRFIKLEISKD